MIRDPVQRLRRHVVALAGTIGERTSGGPMRCTP